MDFVFALEKNYFVSKKKKFGDYYFCNVKVVAIMEKVFKNGKLCENAEQIEEKSSRMSVCVEKKEWTIKVGESPVLTECFPAFNQSVVA